MRLRGMMPLHKCRGFVKQCKLLFTTELEVFSRGKINYYLHY